jgi:hypothetical protein
MDHITRQIMGHPAITEPSELAVMLALASHANPRLQCFPSVRRLAQLARLSERGARAILRRLEDKHLITSDISPGRRSNTYTLTLDKSAPPAPQPNTESKPPKPKPVPAPPTPAPTPPPNVEPSKPARVTIITTAKATWATWRRETGDPLGHPRYPDRNLTPNDREKLLCSIIGPILTQWTPEQLAATLASDIPHIPENQPLWPILQAYRRAQKHPPPQPLRTIR